VVPQHGSGHGKVLVVRIIQAAVVQLVSGWQLEGGIETTDDGHECGRIVVIGTLLVMTVGTKVVIVVTAKVTVGVGVQDVDGDAPLGAEAWAALLEKIQHRSTRRKK
jgi:hypothetical protein